uniref:keratin, type II cytoskeletal 8-like n=1 Tax=Pristiophorus japonicus TaxID=55135 RepID=UPI00398F4FF0
MQSSRTKTIISSSSGGWGGSGSTRSAGISGSFTPGRRAYSMVQSPGTRMSISQGHSSIRGFGSSIGSGRVFGSGRASGRAFGGSIGGGLIQAVSQLDLSTPFPQNDTSLQQVRANERQQMMGLNNQFASFIDKVVFLEQRNKELEIKLKLMKEQGTYKSNIDSMFQAYIDNLKRQLDTLGQEKLKFEADLLQMQGLVEDFKGKYEDEINRRTEMENEFVLVKKDVDDSYMNKVELEAKLESLTDEIDFLRSIFIEEINELQAQIQNTSVSVQLACRPALDVNSIVNEAKAQYETLAARSREEALQWKANKMQELSNSSGQYGDDLRSLKLEITELNNRIRSLTTEIDRLKQERLKLEAAIGEAEERGEMSLKDAKLRIQELEAAIVKASQELAIQVRQYQELMTVKLALDLEISTYGTLLQGEEQRMITGVKTLNIQQVQGQGQFQQFNDTSKALTGFGLETSMIGHQQSGGSIGMGGNKSVIVKSVQMSSSGYTA